MDTTKSIALNMLKNGLLMVMCLGVECCVCDCFLDNSSSSSISIFNSGHATHLQFEVSEHDTSSSISSSGCPVCIFEKKSHRQHLKECSSRPQHTLQSACNHHESNASENNGLQQILQFEILNNLQTDQGLGEIENIPQLKLDLPAVYHEKVPRFITCR